MAVSNCDNEMMDVFRGIELNYKLNSTISSLPKNQKFSAEQLEGYLKKQGVSPYEIKASRLFDNFKGDNRTFTAAEWDSMNLGEQMFENKFTAGHESNSYAKISLGNKGKDPDADYRVKEFLTTKQNKSTNLTHEFGDDTYEEQSQLGWNRVHQDEINGKPSTVLNELQSDWMQAERQGAGVFESKVTKAQKDLKTKHDKRIEQIRNDDSYETIHESNNALNRAVDNYFEEFDKLSPPDYKLVADFPMKPEKFQQLMIVDAINESIENGTNRVVIPIHRENELMGTAGVTKVYEGLSKQLKTIKTKLGKSNLELKIGREDYSTLSIKDDDGKDIAIDYLESAMTIDEYNKIYQDIVRKMDGFDYDNIVEVDKWYKEAENYVKNSKSANKNELHTIEVVQKPNTQVKWDVYALISALGLTSSAMNMEAAQNYKNEGSIEGIKRYIADIESLGSGGYNAHNKSSGAKGKYQLTPIMLKDLGLTANDIKTPAQQEKVMSKLVDKYNRRLKKFKLPVTKENIFIVHNLGMTGGIRVLRNHPTKSDISNMKDQLPDDVGKTSDKEIIHNYKLRYNIDK